jgi:predicted pyridoxine 5'-phosphate oxidase superfamily flavin-nucleotide-binding protein
MSDEGPTDPVDPRRENVSSSPHHDSPGALYGPGARALQDEFDSRRLADRLAEVTLHDVLDDGDVALIRDQAAVWIATVDADGWPDVSYKGGAPDFVEIVAPDTLRIPFFNGNGMWRTLGNVRDTGRVALLFVDQHRPWRMRVHGTATVHTEPSIVEPFHEAEAVLEIRIARVFPNCGRYVHGPDAPSPYVPERGRPTPIPDWKRLPVLREVLPEHDPARAD